MKLKEIWQFIKSVIWPAAKPFICASKEEAAELVVWARNAERIANAAEKNINLDRDNVPVFVTRCVTALEENE